MFAVAAPRASRARRAASVGPAPIRRSWADVAKGVPREAPPPPPPALRAQPAPQQPAPQPAAPQQPALQQPAPQQPAPQQPAPQQPAPKPAPPAVETTQAGPAPPPPLTVELEKLVANPGKLRPGAPGSRACPCHGEVLIMLGHYGWLSCSEAIDHPDVGRHAGRIYVRREDIDGGASLAAGDRVFFFLYADDQGLGAEGVRLEDAEDGRRRTNSCGPELRYSSGAAAVARGRHAPAEPAAPPRALPRCFFAGAVQCAPWTPPAPTPAWAPKMSAAAQEFVPSFTAAGWAAPAPTKPAARAACAINLAYFSDNSDSDEESDAGCGKARSAGSSAGSTGAPSDDSDEEALAPPPGLPLPPPPGLAVHSGRPLSFIRPPPGLSLC